MSTYSAILRDNLSLWNALRATYTMSLEGDKMVFLRANLILLTKGQNSSNTQGLKWVSKWAEMIFDKAIVHRL